MVRRQRTGTGSSAGPNRVHGARAVLRTAPKKSDAKHAWALEVASRRGASKAIVAIANKMARVIWLLLAKKEEYRLAV